MAASPSLPSVSLWCSCAYRHSNYENIIALFTFKMDARDDIIVPPALKPGDTLGIAAPAGWFDRDLFQQGVDVLETMGFQVEVPEGLFQKKRYMAGTDEHRAQVFNRLIVDPSIQGVLCARGGFGSMRILSFLDFDAIQAHPKIIAGFSDISLLLNVITNRTGLVTFHAPVVTSLAGADGATRTAMSAALTAVQPLRISAEKGVTIAPGVVQGSVMGGNLASICHLIGTPWQPSFDGCILFLEDTNEPAYRIDRMFSQMRMAGCLDNVAGMVFGTFETCGRREVIYEIAAEQAPAGIPVIAGLAVGHGPLNITLPLGLTATLDANHHVLIYHAPAVSERKGRQ